jgi:uncharacterized membrane protein
LLLLLAFALRLVGLTTQSLWRDEVDALRFSQEPLPSLVANFWRPAWNGPLYYVLLRLWVHVTGETSFALRYLSLCFGVLSVALTYRLVRAWFTPLVGGLAAVLMASSPYMVWYGQEAKMYALLCAVVLATLYLYWLAVQHGGWLLWGAVWALLWTGVAIHFMAGLLVPVLVVHYLVWWPIARRQREGALLVLAGVILPTAAILPWAIELLITGGDIGHRFVDLPAMIVTLLHAFGRGILATGRTWPMGLALFGLLAGSLLRSSGGLLPTGDERPNGRLGQGRQVLALWTWLVVPVLGLYAISLRVPLFLDRYLIWIGPALYALIGRGLDQVRRRSSLIFALCLLAMVGFNGWGVWQQSSQAIKSDFRGASAYVRQHREPDELLLFHISYVRYTFEYYYGDASPYAEGIPTDEQTKPELVDALMTERTTGRDVVWLVLSEPEMWDRRGMTVSWLDAHGIVEMRSDFARVSVIKYRLAD